MILVDEGLLRELGKCGRCNGDGEYLPRCYRCDDSTDDHECPGPRACVACEQTGLVKAARDALASPPLPLPSPGAMRGFLRWIAEHPDVGDSATSVAREERFQREARKLLAGEEASEAWAGHDPMKPPRAEP